MATSELTCPISMSTSLTILWMSLDCGALIAGDFVVAAKQMDDKVDNQNKRSCTQHFFLCGN